MVRKKFKNSASKWANDICLIESQILRFDENNKLYPNGKYKNVFYCHSKNDPNGRMCVLWGRTIAQPGDIIQMKGRFEGNVFIVWSMMIQKKLTENKEVNI